MYSKTTHGIKVNVYVSFLEEESRPEKNDYVWAYHISLENERDTPVRLTHRHWRITDTFGRVQDVFGEGVVGKTPTLLPQKTFEYASGTPLSTPSGIMVGTYTVLTPEGESLSIDIPAFSLDSPYEIKTVH